MPSFYRVGTRAACARAAIGLFARDAAEESLQIARLGDGRMHRMIRGLPAAVENLHEAARMPGRSLDEALQLFGRQMIRARAAHQQRITLEQPHRDLVELAIRRLSARHV